jgi:hypothetical protein
VVGARRDDLERLVVLVAADLAISGQSPSSSLAPFGRRRRVDPRPTKSYASLARPSGAELGVSGRRYLRGPRRIAHADEATRRPRRPASRASPERFEGAPFTREAQARAARGLP